MSIRVIRKEVQRKINSELKEITASEEVRQLESRVSDAIIKNKELFESETEIRSNTSNNDIMGNVKEIIDLLHN